MEVFMFSVFTQFSYNIMSEVFWVYTLHYLPNIVSQINLDASFKC